MGLLNRLSNSINKKSQTFGQISSSSIKDSTTDPYENLNIQVTDEYLEIKELIDQGNKLIFVTGGAGTGKSTFIKWIEKIYRGEIVIAAPTGIAALTVAGVTIHRLCKFPPAWILDSDIKKDPKSVIPKINIIILDEISMVNANLLDALDKFCKVHRKNKKPFGGLVVIMVGDLFQLPPIVTKTTESLFRREYDSPKFFSAHSVLSATPVGVELHSPFRQKDEHFIKLLRNVREGIDIDYTIEQFNSICKITDSPDDGAVHLAPRNIDVEIINNQQLKKLKPPEYIYEATLQGKFSESQLPAPNKVVLRKGAQVVFLNNSKEWVNGSVGIVNSLSEEKAVIRLVTSNREVEVRRYEWKNYEYVFNEEEKKVERKVIGRYSQLPITLAWAMTIHKSQGLTLDRVHLNLGAGAFETGQTYVALSRCRNLESLSLQRKIKPQDVLIDRDVVNFYSTIRA